MAGNFRTFSVKMARKPVFGEANGSDATTLSRISRASKAYWGYPKQWLDLWKEDLTITPAYIRNNHLFKVLVEDRVVGFCSLEKHLDFWEIGHCWVLPEYIGQGLGTSLLQYALKKSVPPGSRLRVISDPNALPFYKKFGFRVVGSVGSQPAGRSLPLLEAEWKPDTLLKS